MPLTYKVVDESDAIEPCKECGKTLRDDFEGYCMDCADENGISDLFSDEEKEQNRKRLEKGTPTKEEKTANLKRMQENLAKAEGIDPDEKR